MKMQLKQIFIILFALLLVPAIAFSYCGNVYIQKPKLQWYLDECGQWHEGLPDEDEDIRGQSYIIPTNSTYNDNSNTWYLTR